MRTACERQALERRVGVRRGSATVAAKLNALETKFDGLMTEQLREFLDQCALLSPVSAFEFCSVAFNP